MTVLALLRALKLHDITKISKNALLFLICCVPRVALAQDDLDALSKKADGEINEAYRGCLAQFAPNLKEQLRIAQRAWILFTEKDEAAASFAGKRRGLSEDDLGRESLNEVNARANQLRSFFQLPNEDLQSCRQDWLNADKQLTTAYHDAMAVLAPDEQKRLREAERAWIDYRDKNDRAHIGDPSGRAPIWAAVVVTRRRTEELQNFYVRLPTLPPASVQPTGTSTPSPPPLDPVVRAKLAADFHAEVEQLLKQLPTQPALKNKALELDQLPAFNAQFSERLATVAQDTKEVRKKLGYDTTVHDFKEDTTVVDSLTAIDELTRDVRSGNAVQASEVADSFQQQYPTAPGDASKSLWEMLQAMQTLLRRLHDDAKIHLEKATSLSAAGKSGDAIREYQKAFDVFPDPAVAEKIKQLREDSLGL